MAGYFHPGTAILQRAWSSWLRGELGNTSGHSRSPATQNTTRRWRVRPGREALAQRQGQRASSAFSTSRRTLHFWSLPQIHCSTCQQSPGYIPSRRSPGNHLKTVSKLSEVAKVLRSLVYPVWVKAEPERNRPVGTVLLTLLKEQSCSAF